MLKEKIFDFLFAPKAICMGCASVLGADKGPLCNECHNKLAPLYNTLGGRTYRCMNCGEILEKKRCSRCAKSTAGGMYAYSAYAFEEPVRSIIHNFKYKSVHSMARWMAEEQVKATEKYEKEFDLIVPVPIHFLRRLERGYNQSEKLSKEMSKLTGIPFENALKRIRHTPKQSRADKEERHRRLKGAFIAVKDVKGKKILLVDDVITTGSTMIECVHALQKAGCESVSVSTFALTTQKADK